MLGLTYDVIGRHGACSHNTEGDLMRAVFIVVGLLSMAISLLTMMGAKSAIHEILGAVGFLTSWLLIAAAAVIHAVTSSAEKAAAQVVAAIERNADRNFEAIKQGIAQMPKP